MKTGVEISAENGALLLYFTVQGTPDVPVSKLPLSFSPSSPSIIPEGMNPVEVVRGGWGTEERGYACLGDRYAMFDLRTEGYCLVRQ